MDDQPLLDHKLAASGTIAIPLGTSLPHSPSSLHAAQSISLSFHSIAYSLSARQYQSSTVSSSSSPSPTSTRRQWRAIPGDTASPIPVGHDHDSVPILQHINGHVTSGTLLAIMGASGTGKTCILDILAARHKMGRVTGTVMVNGRPRAADFTQISGYVMQDDALIANLTVRETLYYSLALRVAPSSMNQHEREQRIQSILDVLGLTCVADHRIGSALKRGLSGGERRRVSIGVELVTSPSILFVDEPTSGLDASNSLRVMRALRALCNTNRTVICTIHQPRSNVFQMFDTLLLLAQGQVVYHGPTPASMMYFKKLGYACAPYINPADYYLDILEGKDDESQSVWTNNEHGDTVIASDNKHGNDDSSSVPLTSSQLASRVDDLIVAYHQSAERRSITNQIDQLMFGQSSAAIAMRPTSTASSASANSSSNNGDTYGISWMRQTYVLSSRLWLATLRDSSIMYVRTAAALLIGLLVGGIFWSQPDNHDSADARIHVLLFLMCVFSLFCLPAISKCIEDRLLFNREHAAGYYSTSAYFVAAFTVELPILCVIVICYGTICYWMVGLQPSMYHFSYFITIILLVINVGFSVSQLIGAAVQQVNMAIAVYMIVLVYSLLMGGFIVPRAGIPSGMRWALYTSWFNYGFEALCINEFTDKPWGHDILVDLDMDHGSVSLDLWVLFAMFIFFRVAAYLALRYLHREKR